VNWHNTLNEALGEHVKSWPWLVSISYNETVQVVRDGLLISVSRDNRGMYETAIVYPSKCEDFTRHLPFC